jgi:novobiocin biosynthesis protein NovU/D-mycarose 3-C-methyltransferase
MTATGRPAIARRAACRGCDGADLEEILSLGPTPLANAYLRSPDEFAGEPRFPLDLHYCRGCGLFQLLDVVDPEILFRHYLYVTGTSSTMASHNRAYARTLADLLGLRPGDLVVEVASNDGSLLQCFRALGASVLGVEPATNLAARAREAGVETVNEFFTSAVGETLRAGGRTARAVVANNVLAHVDDPLDFLRGCRALVADDGLVTIEVPYVRDLLDRLEYDTVYHEHLSYFSISALLRLCERAGLSAVRIDRVPVHGGSLRLYLSRAAAGHSAAVRALQADEARDGLLDPARYRRFADDVRAGREALLRLLEDLVARGRRVAAYGAPAKGNTLLNYCGIDTRLIPYTVDKNPLKVGLYLPGTHIPVRGVETLANGGPHPDYLVILAWNFADEIMEEQRAHRDRGGRFIVPVPRPKVV